MLILLAGVVVVAEVGVVVVRVVGMKETLVAENSIGM